MRLSVVASDTDIVVVGKLRQHVVQLAVEHLLTSENVEAVEFDQAAHPRTAALPTIAALGVAPIGVADIIGGYGQLLRRGAKGHGGKQGENQQFLHFKDRLTGFKSNKDTKTDEIPSKQASASKFFCRISTLSDLRIRGSPYFYYLWGAKNQTNGISP